VILSLIAAGLALAQATLCFFPDSSDFILKDIIYNLRFLKQVSGFRTKYDYDNNLYIIAGEVVARVTGKSWDEFVQERIIEPLGMIKTATSFERLKDKTDVIDGHAPVNGKVQVIARSTVKVGHSAGGINSNITDLCKWVQLWLNKGKYGDGFSKLCFQKMFIGK
jgi:CubicO group peptidase (beta-lactamase class C family)